MTTPRASLPTLRAFLGSIACRQTGAVSARGLKSLEGGLTETDVDVRDTVNAIVTALDSVAVVVDVTAYGAKGDGVTDDTAAFVAAEAAANDAGGTVYIPAGEYVVGPMVFSGRIGLSMRGEGRLSTRLIPSSAASGAAIIKLVNCREPKISDMWIDGSASYPPSAGIESHVESPGVDPPTGNTFARIRFGGVMSNGMVDGIKYTHTTTDSNNDVGRILNCDFVNLSGAGVRSTSENSLGHHILGGTMSSVAYAVRLAGGSFTMHGTTITSTNCDFLIEAATYNHPSFVIGVVSESSVDVIRGAAGSVRFAEFRRQGGTINSRPIDWASTGVLVFEDCDLDFGQTGTKFRVSDASGLAVISNTSIGIHTFEVTGVLHRIACRHYPGSITDSGAGVVTEALADGAGITAGRSRVRSVQFGQTSGPVVTNAAAPPSTVDPAGSLILRTDARLLQASDGTSLSIVEVGDFEPTDLGSDCLIWLAPDRGVTTALGVITAWANQNEALGGATFGVGARPAISGTTKNGRPLVAFTGAQAGTFTGITSTAADYLILAVLRRDSSGAGQYLFDNQTDRLAIAMTDGVDGSTGGYYDGAWRQVADLGSSLQVVCWDLRATTNGRVFVNGAQIGTTKNYTARALGGGALVLGAAYGAAGNFITALLGDFIVIKNPTDARRRKLTNWARSRWNLW